MVILHEIEVDSQFLQLPPTEGLREKAPGVGMSERLEYEHIRDVGSKDVHGAAVAYDTCEMAAGSEGGQ